MYRIDSDLEPPRALTGGSLYGDFDRTLLRKLGVKVATAIGRCQHGYQRHETCVECENGYADDHHTFANLRSDPLYALVSDDGTSVEYISTRYENKLKKAGYA